MNQYIHSPETGQRFLSPTPTSSPLSLHGVIYTQNFSSSDEVIPAKAGIPFVAGWIAPQRVIHQK